MPAAFQTLKMLEGLVRLEESGEILKVPGQSNRRLFGWGTGAPAAATNCYFYLRTDATSGDIGVYVYDSTAAAFEALQSEFARGDLTQDDAQIYDLPLENFRVTATGALLGTSAGTPSGAFGITYGTHGTAPPKIVSEAASAGSITNKMRQTFVLPPEYVSGETVTLRVRGKETVAAATVDTTIDAEVYKHDKDGGIGSDLCATAAQSVTTAAANFDFTITPTGLAAGDRLDVELTGVSDDTGGSQGTILEIYSTEMLLDIKA